MTTTDRETVQLSTSHTEMTELLLPDDTNFLGRALGGVILHWMDICGAIAAMRFANRQCVTASMDHVDFIAPIDVGEVATIQAYAFETGRSSIDVKVDVHAEDPQAGESWDATSSFLTYVALDDDGAPTEVPNLVCESDAERQHRDAALDEQAERLEDLVSRLED